MGPCRSARAPEPRPGRSSAPASDKTVDQNGQPIVPAYAYSDVNPPPVPAAIRGRAQAGGGRGEHQPDAAVGPGVAGKPLEPPGRLAEGRDRACPADAGDRARSRRQPRRPGANLIGGARYLRYLLDQFGGDVEKALAAYNAGPGRVRSAGGVPAIAETRAYVASIVRRISYSTGASQ